MEMRRLLVSANIIRIDEYISILDTSDGYIVKVGKCYNEPLSDIRLARDLASIIQGWMATKGTWRKV
jgi:hypothetical protein